LVTLPAEIVAKRLDKELRANDMCRVRVLRREGLAASLKEHRKKPYIFQIFPSAV
jgi:hypothetical protein